MTRLLSVVVLLVALSYPFDAARAPAMVIPRQEVLSASKWSKPEYLLAKILCNYETRAEADPSDAIGRLYGEIGRCQILVETARRVSGFRGSNQALINDMFNRSEWYAEKVIRECYARGWLTPQNAAMCYHRGSGFNKTDQRTRLYGKNIGQSYAYWNRKISWRHLRKSREEIK